MSFFHAGDIIFKRNQVSARLGAVVAEELREFVPACAVVVNSVFEVLCEIFVELVVVFFVLSDFVEKFDGLLYNVLSDNFENLVLLEGFTRNVER